MSKDKANNAYWVGKKIVKSGMTMGEPAKEKAPEQTALLPIDPKREAYAQATRLLREYQYDQKLRIRYKAFPGQVEDVVNCFNEIIYSLEAEIKEIDKTSK